MNLNNEGINEKKHHLWAELGGFYVDYHEIYQHHSKINDFQLTYINFQDKNFGNQLAILFHQFGSYYYIDTLKIKYPIGSFSYKINELMNFQPLMCSNIILDEKNTKVILNEPIYCSAYSHTVEIMVTFLKNSLQIYGLTYEKEISILNKVDSLQIEDCSWGVLKGDFSHTEENKMFYFSGSTLNCLDIQKMHIVKVKNLLFQNKSIKTSKKAPGVIYLGGEQGHLTSFFKKHRYESSEYQEHELLALPWL